jgi:thiamine kinase-like enzyme/2-polyprenyl-3-methyl-5-hydroxy-6-metoxy-1,4-benzoquinol methylase
VLASDPVVATGLERLISERLSAPAKHVRAEELNIRKTPHPKRQYSRHWLSVAGRDEPLSVFVKLYRRRPVPPWEPIISSLDEAGFKFPTHYGSLKWNEEDTLGVWEWMDFSKVHPAEFLNSKENLPRIVEAIARINTFPLLHPALKTCGFPVGTRWVNKEDEWFDRRYNKMFIMHRDALVAANAEPRMRKILAEKPGAVARQNGGHGQSFLTHNDLHGNNFVSAEDGRFVLFDWDGATLTAPGADLLFMLGRHKEERRLVADLYSDAMAKLGYPVTPEDVTWNAELVLGFKRLTRGLLVADMNWVNIGLSILERALGIETQAAGTSAPASTAAANAKDIPAAPPAKQDASMNADPRIVSLLERVQKHADSLNGKIYAPVPHPAFASFKSRHGPERFDIMEPHLEFQGGTALDIGAHWGYMAHRLEDLGYKVTAIEINPVNAKFMEDIRDLCGKTFEVVSSSIFDIEKLDFDVVFALNILHHFLRTEEKYIAFEKMLARMKCKMMIVQPQDHERKMMIGAYRNMPSEEFVSFLSQRLSLPNVSLLGKYHGREIYKLKQ